MVRLPAPFVPHSTSLGPAKATQVLSARLLSLPLLPVWMNVYFFISLVSDLLVIRFSVNSGCARRRSVSTYTAVLVLLAKSFNPTGLSLLTSNRERQTMYSVGYQL